MNMSALSHDVPPQRLVRTVRRSHHRSWVRNTRGPTDSRIHTVILKTYFIHQAEDTMAAKTTWRSCEGAGLIAKQR